MPVEHDRAVAGVGVGVGVGLGAGAGESVVGGLGFVDLSPPHDTNETAPTAQRMMATGRLIWITPTSPNESNRNEINP